MAGLVLDATVALALVMPDERKPQTSTIETMRRDGAVVPGLWWLEVANTLLMASRRRRIGDEFRKLALRDLATLPVSSDAETDMRAWNETLALAERYDLTVYDAAYLELAHRRGLPLASFDGDLRKVARKAKIPLLD